MPVLQRRRVHRRPGLDHRVVQVVGADGGCLVQLVLRVASRPGRRSVRAEQVSILFTALTLSAWSSTCLRAKAAVDA